MPKALIAFVTTFVAMASCGAPEPREGTTVTPGAGGSSLDAAAGGQSGAMAGHTGGAAGGAGGTAEASGGMTGGSGGGMGGTPMPATGGNGPSGTGGSGGMAPPTNKAPQVTLTVQAPNMLFAGTSVNLKATASDDGLPAGSALAVQWSKVSGPGDAVFSAAAMAETTATFSRPGAYLLRAAVSDGALSGMAERSFVVLPVATALRSHVRFDEGQGTSAADVVMGNPAAVAAQAGVWAPGKFGSSVNCQGIANTFTLPNSNATTLGADDFTLSMWVRSTQVLGAGQYPELLWKQVSGGRIETILYQPPTGPTEVVFKVWEGQVSTTVASPFAMNGAWHHVGMRRKGNQISVSVDGVVKGPSTLSVRLLPNTGTWLICGFAEDWARFVGGIDDLRIYGRALEDAELKLLSDGLE